CVLFFFFNDTATTEIYTLPLHDALPISIPALKANGGGDIVNISSTAGRRARSEEHTSELQSLRHLVCRLLLETNARQSITEAGFFFRPSCGVCVALLSLC